MKPLREIWMKIGMEKINMHEGVTVKALLDSGTTGIFINRKFAKKHGFRIEKLDRPSKVTNVDGMDNVGGSITHEIKCNIYYKGHVERIRMDVCNLGQMEVILGMPWLAVHNLEIDWEKEKVKMTRCPPMCGKNRKVEKREMRKMTVSQALRGWEEEKAVNWVVDEKEDWEREEEIEIDHWKIKSMVPKWFHQ